MEVERPRLWVSMREGVGLLWCIWLLFGSVGSQRRGCSSREGGVLENERQVRTVVGRAERSNWDCSSHAWAVDR